MTMAPASHARLTRYGLLSVQGEDARAFLHAQLTNDLLHLPQDRAALAGWCSAKGRLLATFLVVPTAQGFLLQLSKDLAAPVAKRLSMFVLRSKVKVADESALWQQWGIWGEPPFPLAADTWAAAAGQDAHAVRAGAGRTLLLTRSAEPLPGESVEESRWALEEIRAGRPIVTAATQELFVPQMVNLHQLGGVDFRKGCYPGQEVVARTQYRGQLKRHMVHATLPGAAALGPGAEYQGGTVVDAAAADGRTELLAVVGPQE